MKYNLVLAAAQLELTHVLVVIVEQIESLGDVCSALGS